MQLFPLLIVFGCSPTNAEVTASADTMGTTTGASTDASTGGMSTGGMSTGTASDGTGTATSSTGPDPTTGGASSGTGTSTGGETSGGSTGDASTGGTSGIGETSGSSTGGGVVASFTCAETTPVELYLKESISGSFTADGTPVELTAVMVKGGAVDFHVATALPVDPNDPNAADVAAFEASLTMTGWDVNIDDMSGDRRYFFAPEGAQNVAIFPAFYYRVYGGGGNGQFEFDCELQ